MRKKHRFIFLVCFLVGVAFISFILFLKSELSNRLYREISYHLIARRVTANQTDEMRTVSLLMDYLHSNLHIISVKPIDDNPWEDLVRGVAWCDQIDCALATLLATKKISARLVCLKDDRGSSPHSVAEVYLNNKWGVVDPLNGIMFINRQDGSLATLEEMSKDFSIISENPSVTLLSEKTKKRFLTNYSRFIPIRPNLKYWRSMLEKKNDSFAKRIANKVIELLLDVFGHSFAYLYQDVYLPIKTETFEDKDYRLYYKARNYHIYERTDQAEKFYKKLLTTYPQSNYADHAQFFLGVLNINLKRDYKSALYEFANLFKKYPDSRWKEVAHYYVARAYEGLKDYKQARENYLLASDDLYTDAVWRLHNLPLN